MLIKSASSTDLEEVANIIILAAKAEKLSDFFMFNKNQKKLHLFVTKFCFKLSENAN